MSNIELKMNLEDGRYNARDVLGMCRAYVDLRAALDRVGTTEVYKLDRRLARIALQMTKVGMPVDLEERERVAGVLQKLRDEAAERLLVFTKEPHYAGFVDWVSRMYASAVRKDDPKSGMEHNGVTLSDEIAFEMRVQIRRGEFEEKLGKAALQEAVYKWVEHGTANGTLWNQFTLAEALGVDPKQIGNMFRSWGKKGIFQVTERVEGKGKEKRKFYDAVVPPLDTPEAREEHKDLVDEVVKGINIGAKVQQAAILRVAGVPLIATTEKTKLPKIDKDVLEQVGHHQAARDMLQFILTDKALSMVESFKIEPSPFPGYGVIRPDWDVHKITGRWGSSPNVQNWSKRAGGGVENIRRMIAAPPGFIIVGADYAQLEARLMAAQSQDPFLMGIFQNKLDIHSEFGKIAFPHVFPKLVEVFESHKAHLKATGESCGPDAKDPKSKCEFCKQRDKLRDQTKRLEYGGLYGGAVETLWQAVVKDVPDLQLETVRQFMIAVNVNCKGLRKWQADLLESVIRNGVIRSPILGRCQFFPMGRVDPTVVSNYPMQAGGSDLWGIGATKFADRYDQWLPPEKGPRIFHNGHDSVSILTTEDRADEVCKAVEECWTIHWAGVDFPIEPAAAHRWSDT